MRRMTLARERLTGPDAVGILHADHENDPAPQWPGPYSGSTVGPDLVDRRRASHPSVEGSIPSGSTTTTGPATVYSLDGLESTNGVECPVLHVVYRIGNTELKVSCDTPAELESVLDVVERRALQAESSARFAQGILHWRKQRLSKKDEEVPEVTRDENAPPEEPLYNGNDAYTRKEVMKQELRQAGTPLSPKEIVDRLERRDDFSMDAKDWKQAVRYVLTRPFSDEFESRQDGRWWIKDEPLPNVNASKHFATGSSSDA